MTKVRDFSIKKVVSLIILSFTYVNQNLKIEVEDRQRESLFTIVRDLNKFTSVVSFGLLFLFTSC